MHINNNLPKPKPPMLTHAPGNTCFCNASFAFETTLEFCAVVAAAADDDDDDDDADVV